jgi:hypothetical protein
VGDAAADEGADPRRCPSPLNDLLGKHPIVGVVEVIVRDGLGGARNILSNNHEQLFCPAPYDVTVIFSRKQNNCKRYWPARPFARITPHKLRPGDFSTRQMT